MNVCQDNMRCRENPETCGYSIECSSFDKGKNNYFIAGRDCPKKHEENICEELQEDEEECYENRRNE